MSVDEGFVLSQAKKCAVLYGASGFVSMDKKSEDLIEGTVVYTVTFKNGSGTDVATDMTFRNGKDGLNGTNGIDGAAGINGIDGADGPKVSGITFVDDDMVFAFNDGTTVLITDAKTTLKGDAGGSLVGPIERPVATNGQDTYEVAEHVVGSSALIVFAEGAKISQSDYDDIDATHIKLKTDIASTLTTGMKVTTMFLSTMDSANGEIFTSALKLKLEGLTGQPKGNLNASIAPTSTDDKTKGYSQGSTWIYNSVTYTCTDDTENNAIWTSSADIFYFDTWDSLVTAISATGTTYVSKYAVVANANGGVIGGATYTAPTTLVSYIVDGGQATYKVNSQGTNYSVICQARTVNNPTITSVMTIASAKPTTIGYYIFTVAPTDGLPVGVSLNDIAYYNGTNWSVFQSYAVTNAVVVVGLMSSTQVVYRKQAGSWVDVTNNSDVSVGDVKITARATAPSGWLKCDYSEYSRTTYANLFSAIGTTFGAGNGTTTFNVPDMVDRTPIGAGQATFKSIFLNTSVNIATDIITVENNESLITGTAVVFTTNGTVPAGLVASTTYYVIRMSATTVKLATSLANAIAGTVINITSQGTGTHTLTVTYTNRVLGQVGGEENHASTVNEMAAHTHQYNDTYNIQNLEGTFNNANACDEIERWETTTATGGSQAHNNMQPFAVVNYIIKY